MELKPTTNGLILNGQIHVLVKTQDEDVCADCSIRDFCATALNCACEVLSDSDDEHFNKV